MTQISPAEVDRAAKAVDRGIQRLITLLGNPDDEIRDKAILALDALGPRAIVGPLGVALTRAKVPTHRLVILALLREYVEVQRSQIAGALARALKQERDPYVLNMIGQITAQIAQGEIHSMARPSAS